MLVAFLDEKLGFGLNVGGLPKTSGGGFLPKCERNDPVVLTKSPANSLTKSSFCRSKGRQSANSPNLTPKAQKVSFPSTAPPMLVSCLLFFWGKCH